MKVSLNAQQAATLAEYLTAEVVEGDGAVDFEVVTSSSTGQPELKINEGLFVHEDAMATYPQPVAS